MRKLFTACLALGFLTAAGIAIFNGFIARPINAYMDATIIAQLMTLPADNITPIATLTAPPVQPTETPTLTAPLAVIVTPTASPLEDVSESVVVTAEVTAEGTEPVLPTAIVIAPPFPPPPTTINNLPIDSMVIVPDVAALQAIYATGQSLGRNPRAFSKLGDSTIENPHFLTRFDEPGNYNLGDFSYLQPVVDFYQGSFGRQGMAVHRGLHTWSVLDPMWADPLNCQPSESMLGCEFRLHNPSVLFIRLGSNDVGIPDSVDENLREIVEFCITNGVIPIMGTKADRHEGGNNINNNIIRQIAVDYHLPLWDFDIIAGTLPGRGMANDGVHLTTFYAHDYTLPEAFTRGYPVHNLTALIMLDRVWRAVMTGQLPTL
jgi:hypothetical protein